MSLCVMQLHRWQLVSLCTFVCPSDRRRRYRPMISVLLYICITSYYHSYIMFASERMRERTRARVINVTYLFNPAFPYSLDGHPICTLFTNKVIGYMGTISYWIQRRLLKHGFLHTYNRFFYAPR